MNKGQFYRLFLYDGTTAKAIAAAKDMNLHLSAQTEESSTKDTTGDALEYEVVGQSYEITGSALVLTDNDVLITGGTGGVNSGKGLNDFLTHIGDNELTWVIAICTGANNRTLTTPLFGGTCKLTNLQINAQNKQKATYSYTLTGYGAISIEDLPEDND